MGKAKIPIIMSLLLMLSLAGFLILKKALPNKDNSAYADRDKASASTVSSGAITPDTNGNINSGNYTYIPPTFEYDDNNENKEENQMSGKDSAKPHWTPATEMDLDPKSITVYVNKEYCLPKDYVPDNLVVPNITFDTLGYSERKLMRKEAAEAIEKLFAAALEEGYTLYGISGYRSYKRQKEIFLNNIVKKGKNHTLKYSAAPGTSEHQTGLAMDVSSKSVRFKLVTAFAYCEEGKWLADHAHEYGFIIRYPKDKSETTGYEYEPWHIRYVGEDLANYLYTNNMTLDEYYNYVPSEDFDYEKKYADLINYRPPATPTPTPIPEDELEEDDLTEEDLPEGELPEGELPEELPEELPDEIIDNEENGVSEEEDWDEDFEEEDTDIDFEKEDNNIEDIDEGDGEDNLVNKVSPTPTPTHIPSDNTEESPPNDPDIDIIN